mgnify:CR=1 FL=1
MTAKTITKKKRGRPRKDVHLSEDRREMILKIAVQAFARRGFDGVAMTEIAREAQVSQTLMHYYFGDKLTLWDEAVGLAYNDLHGIFDGFETEFADFDCVDQLKIATRRFVRVSALKPEIAMLNIQSMSDGGERLSHVINDHIGPLQTKMVALMEQAKEEGLMKPVDSAHTLQIAIGAVVHFLITGKMTQQIFGIDPSSEDSIRKHADLVVETLFHGLLTDENLSD